MVDAIEQEFGDDDASAWQIQRTDKAYRVQYELFRRGELRRSQSMLASILDRLLQNDSEMRSKDQRIDGGGLPQFEKISHFLQPSGMMVRTTNHGWEFGSLLLSGEEEFTETELSNQSQIGTARRVSTSQTEAKR